MSENFNYGYENVDDDLQASQPHMLNEDLIYVVEEKVCEDGQFNMSSLSLHFQQISRSVLHTVVSDRVDYWKFCSQWVPKMLTEVNTWFALQAVTFYDAGI